MSRPRGAIALLTERFEADSRPDELDALVQADEVGAALQNLGWRVEAVEAGHDLFALHRRLESLGPALVFNLVEAYAGNAAMIATVPAFLESTGFRLTGCSAEALFLTSHKVLAKRWMRCHGLPTPDWVEDEAIDTCGGRWIVKSVWEHASLGLDDGCVVTGADGIRRRRAESRQAWGGRWFAERFVDGREFNVSVLEIGGRPQILPVAEIEFDGYAATKPRIVGYAAKWEPAAAEYHATRREFPMLPAQAAERIAAQVAKCWQVFGLGGYARVDMRMDADGTPWILEINANPCLSRDAGFVAAAERAGIGHEALVGQIVSAALQRHS